jgi:hypothetical protein
MCKILCRITQCYYPSWKHSLTALAKHTLIEMLDIFSLRAVVGLSVAPTNNSPLVLLTVNTLPHRVRHAHPNPYIILTTFICYTVLKETTLCIWWNWLCESRKMSETWASTEWHMFTIRSWKIWKFKTEKLRRRRQNTRVLCVCVCFVLC